MTFDFKQDVPVGGMDIFEFKDKTFQQLIPEKCTQHTMTVLDRNVTFYDGCKTVNTSTTTTGIVNCSLCVYFKNDKKYYVVDIMSYKNKNLNNSSLYERMNLLEKLVYDLGSKFIFVKPSDIGIIKNNKKNKVRFVKDKPLGMFPGMVLYNTITCDLTLTDNGLFTFEGIQVLKKQSEKLKHPLGLVTIKMVKNKIVILKTAIKADKFEYVKKCLLAGLKPVKYSDISYFNEFKKIQDHAFLNKNDTNLTTAIIQGTPLLKYSPFDLISLDTTLSPEIINQLSVLYETNVSRLATEISEQFPSADVREIRNRIPGSFCKKLKLNWILNHTGCIVCKETETVFQCEVCKQSIICKKCVKIIGTKHQFQCDFCSTKRTLTAKNMYNAGVKSDYNYKEVSFCDLFPVQVDNNVVWENSINKIEAIYKQWINSVSLFTTSKVYNVDVTLNVNFGDSNKRIFHLLISRLKFASTNYKICGDDIKHVFNCKNVWSSSYKKNTIRSVKETKYGIKFSLKYNEQIPQKKGKIGKNVTTVTEYVYKINEEWTLMLRNGLTRNKNVYEIVLNSKKDTGVNKVIHKLLEIIY
jgi:hypothetical protein